MNNLFPATEWLRQSTLFSVTSLKLFINSRHFGVIWPRNFPSLDAKIYAKSRLRKAVREWLVRWCHEEQTQPETGASILYLGEKKEDGNLKTLGFCAFKRWWKNWKNFILVNS